MMHRTMHAHVAIFNECLAKRQQATPCCLAPIPLLVRQCDEVLAGVRRCPPSTLKMLYRLARLKAAPSERSCWMRGSAASSSTSGTVHRSLRKARQLSEAALVPSLRPSTTYAGSGRSEATVQQMVYAGHLSPGRNDAGGFACAAVAEKWRGPRSRGIRSISFQLPASSSSSAFSCSASPRETAVSAAKLGCELSPKGIAAVSISFQLPAASTSSSRSCSGSPPDTLRNRD